jgi:membrane-associated phospholipid phosphatase
LLIVYPIAMSLAVVYLGEHYVIDVLIGWSYAVVAFAVVWGTDRGPVAGVLRSLGLRRKAPEAAANPLVIPAPGSGGD